LPALNWQWYFGRLLFHTRAPAIDYIYHPQTYGWFNRFPVLFWSRQRLL
jgi:hypothetical protein